MHGFLGVYEQMIAGDFEQMDVDYYLPDLPEIDQLRKDELYDLEP